MKDEDGDNGDHNYRDDEYNNNNNNNNNNKIVGYVT